MKRTLFNNRTLFIASLLFVLLMLPGISQADDLVKGTMVMPVPPLGQDIDQIAVESVRDSLKACLGRIPADATAGQLLLAELNCEQVDLERNRTHLSF